MAFIPKLFIGIGAEQHFFTLRETYIHEFWVGGQGGHMEREKRSFHHFNLSQDADEAWQKANEASERFGVPLSGSRETLNEEMAAIKRATASQLAEREAQRLAWAEERAAERAAELARKIDLINSGVFAFGPFAGEKFVDAEPTYLEWYVDKRNDFEEGSLPRVTADAIVRLAADRLPIKPDPDATIGEVKQRLEVQVTVTRVFTFYRDSFSGYGSEACHITTMVTPERVCVVVKSGAFCPKVGETLKIRGTVKEHSSYRGQMQTVLQRVAIVG